MLHLEGLDDVAIALQPGIRLDHDCRDGVRQPSEDATERPEELYQSFRAVDRERNLATAERERLEHARKAEVVVGVVVREEDLLELHEADIAAQKLPLRPFGAVEEKAIAAPPDERRGEGALRGRHRARRPEENDVQLHGG